MIARETHAQEALVVAEVEVGLAAIVEDVCLAVLEGAHGPGVDVQVRIDLDGGDAESATLEHPAHGGDGHALAEAGDDPAGDDDVLHFGLIFFVGK